MLRLKIYAAVATAMLTTSAVHAATIVNLNASSVNPNAGNSSPGFTYNPITATLGAGTYSVGVVGIAGGGLYDAYSVYAPTASNLAYTDGNWSVSVNGVVQTQLSSVRFNTAVAAASYYSALTPLTFTLATASTVALFYVDDTAFPYFADDSGGVSLGITQVPEPISLALMATGLGALGLVRWRRAAQGAVRQGQRCLSRTA